MGIYRIALVSEWCDWWILNTFCVIDISIILFELKKKRLFVCIICILIQQNGLSCIIVCSYSLLKNFPAKMFNEFVRKTLKAWFIIKDWMFFFYDNILSITMLIRSVFSGNEQKCHYCLLFTGSYQIFRMNMARVKKTR